MNIMNPKAAEVAASMLTHEELLEAAITLKSVLGALDQMAGKAIVNEMIKRLRGVGA